MRTDEMEKEKKEKRRLFFRSDWVTAAVVGSKNL